jgi:sortase A
VLLGLAALALTGCAAESGEAVPQGERPRPSASISADPTPSSTFSSPATTSPSASRAAPEVGRGPEPSDGRPAAARLTVPDLDLRDLPVVPYRGRTDDARGTAIQNDGDLASPHGPEGGTGPGGIGNYQVTGHRLSSTMPFRYLPRLTRGDVVHVESGGSRYVYRIMATRETSFRSPASLREQRAAVPGRPGVEPTRAMITLSTCATIEDHAEGNFWSDRFDNPEHRIDKIGVLVRVLPM